MFFGCILKRNMTNNVTPTHLFPLQETLCSKQRPPRQLHLLRSAPAQTGCLTTVYLIRKVTDDIYHFWAFHGGKHWVRKPDHISCTRHVKHPPCLRPYGERGKFETQPQRTRTQSRSTIIISCTLHKCVHHSWLKSSRSRSCSPLHHLLSTIAGCADELSSVEFVRLRFLCVPDARQPSVTVFVFVRRATTSEFHSR